jgi:uncharacterized protein YggE
MRKLILSAVLGAILVSSAAHAESETRRVTVSGKCTRQVTPDRGAIVVTADFRDDDLQRASKRATEAYERARDAVKRLNLKDVELRTVEYSMGEVREWEKDRQVFKGYRARMGLRVATSQVDKLGEVIAIATREGLREVGGLKSFLSEAQQLAEQVACLQDAAQNARSKAEKLAAALGARVGETLLVTESGGFQSPPERMMVMDAAPGAGASPPSIEAGQQTLSLAVEVAFALK